MILDLTKYLILLIFFIAFLVKSGLFILLVYRGIKNTENHRKLILLCITLLGSLFTDFTWVQSYIRILFFPGMSICFHYFIVRIAWALCLMQYQSLGIFIESLAEKTNYSLPWYQKILLFINSCCVGYFVFIAFFYCSSKERFWLEITLMKFASFMVCVLLLTVFFVLKKINEKGYSKILRHQLITLLKYIVCPLICMELLLGVFALVSADTHYIIAGCLTILYAIASYYCVFKIMRFRFLNFNKHVCDSQKFLFFKKFGQAIAQLGNTSHKEQLEPIVQMAFKSLFNLDPHQVRLYFRPCSSIKSLEFEKNVALQTSLENSIEQLLLKNKQVSSFVREHRIIIYDEIVFNNINNKTELNAALITFLDALHADVFIPIYRNNTLISVLTIERDAREDLLFSDIECDQMVLYAASLENVINILQNHNLDVVIDREKKIQEELFIKHQEINQFREALETFNRHDKYQKIGIISYTSYNQFVYINQDAKDIITFDLNAYKGHWLTREFQELAMEVLRYKISKTKHTFDEKGAKIIVRAVPFLEKNNVVLMIYYPQIFDFIKQTQSYLKKPTEIDYVLYLETTQAGQIINKIVPNVSPLLVQFKINLLKLALSKRALLLDVPDEDLETMVHILHKISMRETLKSLKLGPEVNMHIIAKSLFGINKIYESTAESTQEKPLLELLHNTGTLFIKNIHLLSIEIQEMLAEYSKYGYFRIYKSDQKVASSVRILCSSRQNLAQLVQENKFSKALFDELNQACLTMPSLADLSDEEYRLLIESFSEQALGTSHMQGLLKFTDYEIQKLNNEKLLSLKELKNRIEIMLKKKSEQKDLPAKLVQFDASYTFAESEIALAAQLGKKALKDPKILEMLMKEFKSQTRVAEFLGVDRSAIYKRLKRFNLL